MSKPYIVSIIGCDNAGKSTFARAIVEELKERGYTATYLPPLGKAPLEKQIEYLDEVKRMPEQVIVMDRFPVIEEEVCGRTLRFQSNFDMISEDERESYLAMINTLILCDPGLKVIQKWGDRKQMDGIKENIRKLHKGYRDFYHTYHKCYLCYDWTLEKPDSYINLIEGLVKEYYEH